MDDASRTGGQRLGRAGLRHSGMWSGGSTAPRSWRRDAPGVSDRVESGAARPEPDPCGDRHALLAPRPVPASRRAGADLRIRHERRRGGIDGALWTIKTGSVRSENWWRVSGLSRLRWPVVESSIGVIATPAKKSDDTPRCRSCGRYLPRLGPSTLRFDFSSFGSRVLNYSGARSGARQSHPAADVPAHRLVRRRRLRRMLRGFHNGVSAEVRREPDSVDPAGTTAVRPCPHHASCHAKCHPRPKTEC
jgi:hypothetical protein